MILYAVRHGTTNLNKDASTSNESIRGWLDAELSDEGTAEVDALAKHFAQKKIDAIYAADLQRTFYTAQTIAAQKDLEVKVTRQLRPINFGELQGKSGKDVRSAVNAIIQAWAFDPKFIAPGGESFADFQARFFSFLYGQLPKHDEKNTIMLVTSMRNLSYLTSLVKTKGMPLQGKDIPSMETTVEPGDYMVMDWGREPSIISQNIMKGEKP